MEEGGSCEADPGRSKQQAVMLPQPWPLDTEPSALSLSSIQCPPIPTKCAFYLLSGALANE